MSIISNFKKLAKNDLRKKALQIAEAGYEAIEIKRVVSRKVKVSREKTKEEFLIINTHNKKEKIDLNNYKKIFLVGIGKGSALASVTLAKILGKKLNGGIALDIQKPKLKIENYKLKILTGTHPLPSQQNVNATQKIIKLAKSLGKDDLLITLICGGGSSLMCGSEKELKASQTVFKELTKAGANIMELNTVRKHLSEVKGGGLAKLAYPATVLSLVISDVCGNDLSFVSSGPTVFDKTTKKDAEKILKKYFNVRTSDVSRTSDVPKLIRVLTETPKDKKYFKKVKNILFVCNQDAVMAMLEKAIKLGFSAKIYSLALEGEAMNALLPIVKMVKQKQAIIAAGETTVNLKNRPKGKGGRNTEAVLGAVAQIQNSIRQPADQILNNLVFISFTSDGRDNTEAAGAIADELTLRKAKKLKMSPIEFLKQNKSFAFFDKTGDLIYAKKRCFNVADLMFVLSLLNEQH
ncbi:MAG: DUF4147 domain-containing protein [Patescibacteria group bacterium]|nr:DUF4147 domain-containing protein [Patescibacteria group bacterium]